VTASCTPVLPSRLTTRIHATSRRPESRGRVLTTAPVLTLYTGPDIFGRAVDAGPQAGSLRASVPSTEASKSRRIPEQADAANWAHSRAAGRTSETSKMSTISGHSAVLVGQAYSLRRCPRAAFGVAGRSAHLGFGFSIGSFLRSGRDARPTDNEEGGTTRPHARLSKRFRRADADERTGFGKVRQTLIRRAHCSSARLTTRVRWTRPWNRFVHFPRPNLASRVRLAPASPPASFSRTRLDPPVPMASKTSTARTC